MNISSAEIGGLLGAYFWPFVRIAAMLMAAPLFGARNIVFVVHRLGLALGLTLIVQPMLAPVPFIDPMSAQGIGILLEQLLLGVAMGFILQMVFASLIVAGHSVALTMGLGFAQFVDPANGLSVPVVSKFYLIIGTLLMFALNGHLIALKVLVESFDTLPVGKEAVSHGELFTIVLWAGKLYVGALLIALPCMVTITLINIGFGVMTRSAPQMNIFAVGFPTTLAAGIVIVMLTLPNLLPRFTDLLMESFDLMQQIIRS